MGKRLHELDALRGIAAFSVLLSHVFLVLPVVWDTPRPDGQPWYLQLFLFSPLRIIWAGHQAVVFFFILSGFVLALPLFSNRSAAPYPLYLIKRILRIYTPYVVAAMAAIALREVFFAGPVPRVSDWFNQSWQEPATAGAVADHLLMIGSFNTGEFNPVIWSLVHEMRISILFPLIVWGLVKNEKVCLILPILFSFIYWLMPSLRYRGVLEYDHDYFATLHWTGFFIAGAWLAKHRAQLVKAASGIPKSSKWLLIGVAILAYTNPFWLLHLDFSALGGLAKIFTKDCFQDWITAAGVVVFIMLAISSGKMSRLLAAKPLEFLGSISYSLYLLHALVLKVLVTVLVGVMPLGLILALVVPVSLLVATASWRYIEVPSIGAGKRVTKWWHRRRPTEDVKLGDNIS